MASGYFTGYQHQLLDHPNLTKEEFVMFCDKAFYHLDHFGITLEEAQNRRAKRITDMKQRLEKAKQELVTHKQKTSEDWKKEYDEYVQHTIEKNQRYAETYRRETEKMEIIKSYIDAMKPHLDYIWREFKEPELYQSDIPLFMDYIYNTIEAAEKTVEYHQRDLDEINQDEEKESRILINDYETKKKAFLEGE